MEREQLHEMRLRQLTALQGFVEHVANQLASEEGDENEAVEAFGLDVSEVIEMEHDNMIYAARAVIERCNAIAGEYATPPQGNDDV